MSIADPAAAISKVPTVQTMRDPNPGISSRRGRGRPLPVFCSLLALFASSACFAAKTDLADQPISPTQSVPGNVLLSLSVEFPTAVDVSNYASTYTNTTTYLGYFDPLKCYTYTYNSSDTSGLSPYFQPASLADSSHNCSGQWSGNFLNWATMQTIDPFRSVMTGGYRSYETPAYGTTYGSSYPASTPSVTILEKAYASGQGGTGDFPDRTITSGITGATPLAWTSLTLRIQGLGNRMYFVANNAGVCTYTTNGVTTTVNYAIVEGPPSTCTAGNITPLSATTYTGQSITTDSTSFTVYSLNVRVKVCDNYTDPTLPVESNCTLYGGPYTKSGGGQYGNYKPEGLIQQYSMSMRFAAMGYLNDSSATRDGGVLRASMNFLGPVMPVPGSSNVSNPNLEWDPNYGSFNPEPDKTDETNTPTATGSGVSVTQSGVINYLNDFGEFAKSYKGYDPVSELYYAGIRYYKNQGNIPAYSSVPSGNKAMQDNFPVITNWTNPIQYACQQNFIVGIGDINTHDDEDLPGSLLYATGAAAGHEPATQPSAVTSDSTVNVTTVTNEIGVMECLKIASGTCTSTNNPAPVSTLGATNISDYATYFIAGLAYDAHVKDMQPSNFNSGSNLSSSGAKINIQTASTYWVDVLEYQSYSYRNQYWLAAKYGGFSVPVGYTEANTAPLPQSEWNASGRTDCGFPGIAACSTTSVKGNPLPDNYFNGGQPALMQAGLKTAFSSIISKITSKSSTSFGIPTPQVQNSNNANYAANYDPSSWTGDVTGSSITITTPSAPTCGTATPAAGTACLTQVWDAQATLDTQAAVSGSGGSQVKGWDTGRLIATSNGPGTTPVPFRLGNLSSNNSTALASVSGSAQNTLNYLRGDKSNEAGGSGTGLYRTRTHLLGDIVNAKITPFSAPTEPLTDSSNPGFSSFYSGFFNSSGLAKNPMVYAGANDGMMHAFDGSLSDGLKGKELFAYVPSFVYQGPNSTPATDGIAAYGNPNFVHHYYVDGTPEVFSIDFARAGGANSSGGNPTPDWHSVLIGGLGKGGQGYYAIDVTSPSSMTTESAVAGKVLWEFTDTHMGYSYGDPSVVKTAKYGWVVLLTSGYNNTDGKGYIFVVDPRNGNLLETMQTNTGSTNSPSGMTFASAYVNNYSDGTADSIYAGDLLGNLWRFDLTSTSGNYPSPKNPFAVLTGASGNPQPVTTRPLIEIDPLSFKRYVLVGTGRLLASSDYNSTAIQSFYAIVDGTNAAFSSGTTSVTRTNLANDTAYFFNGTVPPTGSVAGVGSSAPTTTAYGWYTDLSTGSNGNAGRMTINPTANNGIVAFVDNFPGGDVCAPSGTNDAFVIAFGTATSLVLTSTGTTGGYLSSTGLGTEIEFVNVNGNLYVEEGTDAGNILTVPASLGGGNSPSLLNWREVPTPD